MVLQARITFNHNLYGCFDFFSLNCFRGVEVLIWIQGIKTKSMVLNKDEYSRNHTRSNMKTTKPDSTMCTTCQNHETKSPTMLTALVWLRCLMTD